MKRIFLLIAVLLGIMPASKAEKQRTIHLVTTGDVHGSWFSEPYVDGQRTKTSLMSVKYYVDSLRNAVGGENVILLDAGDALQGDNASYYYNYVATEKPHLFTLVAKYMGYDVMVMGNHDIEAGHPVYDRVNYELGVAGIPWLGGNTVFESTGKPYFPVYTILHKAGLKIAVLGFNNSYIKNWVSEEQWRGMDFQNLTTCVQKWVDKVNAAERPDVTIVAVHSGTGEGNGDEPESQALDLFNSINGVDVLVGAHDHRQYALDKEGLSYVNSGSRAGYVGHTTIVVNLKGKKVASKSATSEVIRLNKEVIDPDMKDYFKSDFDEVKAFTNRKVGSLAMHLFTRDSYKGPCDYINLVHTVEISVPEAQISFAAPLTFNGYVRKGDVVFNDMFTIYPYENQMVVARMKGSEIKDYLEYSYDAWIQTPGEHVLKISEGVDNRTGKPRWEFDGRSYNFDSAAGINYTVDVTKTAGSRVAITTMADGSAFDPDQWYNVAMTSYRANGGGGLIREGAKISAEEMDQRIIAKYPEIRDLIYNFIQRNGNVTSELLNNKDLLGTWAFIPEDTVAPLMEADMAKLFRK